MKKKEFRIKDSPTGHFMDIHDSNPTTLQAFGIDHIPVSIRKGDEGNSTKEEHFGLTSRPKWRHWFHRVLVNMHLLYSNICFGILCPSYISIVVFHLEFWTKLRHLLLLLYIVCICILSIGQVAVSLWWNSTITRSFCSL